MVQTQRHDTAAGDGPNAAAEDDGTSASSTGSDASTEPDEQSSSASDEPALPTLSKGEIFEVLRNQRRRYVLHFLKQDGRPVELGDLAQQIAAWEYETTLEGVTPAQRKRVYTTLQQTHLPKMDEAGILVFDSDQASLRQRIEREISVSTSRSSPATSSPGVNCISRLEPLAVRWWLRCGSRSIR